MKFSQTAQFPDNRAVAESTATRKLIDAGFIQQTHYQQ
jgi:hypothetical protein